LIRSVARDRHQYGEAKDDRPGDRPHQDRIGITEGDEAERQPNKTTERQAQQQPRRDRRQQAPKHNDRQYRRDDDNELNCPCGVEKQQKERCGEDGEAKTAYCIEQRRAKCRGSQHAEDANGHPEHPAQCAGVERHAEQPRSEAGIHVRYLRFGSDNA
jgi:hypothetical protein